MIVRRLTEDDVAECTRIVCGNYDRETAEHFRDEVALSFSHHLGRPTFYVASDIHHQIYGCAGYGPSWLDYGVYSLFWVNTDLGARNRGVGKRLVNQCLLDLTSLASIVVLATTVPAFYSKNWGFKAMYRGKMAMCTILMGLELAKGQSHEDLRSSNDVFFVSKGFVCDPTAS
jgi:GNAT superfamily N-acetyltransferase